MFNFKDFPGGVPRWYKVPLKKKTCIFSTPCPKKSWAHKQVAGCTCGLAQWRKQGGHGVSKNCKGEEHCGLFDTLHSGKLTYNIAC